MSNYKIYRADDEYYPIWIAAESERSARKLWAEHLCIDPNNAFYYEECFTLLSELEAECSFVRDCSPGCDCRQKSSHEVCIRTASLSFKEKTDMMIAKGSKLPFIIAVASY